MVATVIPLPVPRPQKRISVVMVSYHTGAPLNEAVLAVLEDPQIFELILVDNGNTSIARRGLMEIAQKHGRLKLVQGQGNIGFAKGCNYGAKLAKGEYLLFLNPDAVIKKGAAMKMADASANLEKPWISGAMLQTLDGKEQRGARRNELTTLSAFISFTPLHKFPGFKSMHLEHLPKPKQPTLIPIVSGACLMSDRASFEQLGGFDEDYFLHVEDIDICRRARQAGGQVLFVPGAKVMHYGSTSRVRLQKVEHEKLKGFIHYFRKYSKTWWARTLLFFAIPFMFLAIMGRAWFLAFKSLFTEM